MKQVILIEPGRIEVREVPVPEPSNGELLLRINSSLTCGTDLKAYVRGHSLIPMPGPFGHEYAGTIVKTGTGVEGFAEGDEVMGVHSAPCLECKYCERGLYNLCEFIMDKKVLGAFAEYMVLPSHVVRQNLYHKPSGLSFEEAAMLEPLSCVVHPYSRVNLDEVESAAVLGAGPIGLMHAAYLNSRGIKVIASEYFDDKLAIAKDLGAYWTTVPHELETVVHDITSGTGVDMVIECTGHQGAWEKSTDLLRRGGYVILFGGCPADTKVSYDAHRLHYDELTMIGSFHFTPQDVKTALHMLVNRKLDLRPLISGTLNISEIEKAFTNLQEGKGIKYSIVP